MSARVDYSSLTERRCSKCRQTKPVAEFNRYVDASAPLTGWRYYSRCRPCQAAACHRYGTENKPRRNARLRAWRKRNLAAARAKDRRARFRSKYGLTEAQLAELRARFDGLCWLCRRRPAVVVEHDHKTGRVRGVTCHGCNTHVLARVDADPVFLARVAAYLSADVLLEVANA